MKKMSSRQVALHTQVKDVIQGVLNIHVQKHGRGIGYRETFTHLTPPSLSWPYETKVTLYGHTSLRIAWAEYDGPKGRWECQLKSTSLVSHRWTKQEIQEDECLYAVGKPICVQPSGLYQETAEQRRARAQDLATQGRV